MTDAAEMDPGAAPPAGRPGWFVTHRYAILLAALGIWLLTVPAFEAVATYGWRPAVIFARAAQLALLVFACVLAVGSRRALTVFIFSVLAVAVLEGIGTALPGRPAVEIGRSCFACAFVVAGIVHLMRRAFAARVVDAANLHAAAAIYLLLGMAFANAYQILHVLHPGAFHVADGVGTGSDVFLYFSFITLATVGYGDITPVIGSARMLAVVEALAGQVYLVVSVSRLVGLYVAHRTTGDGAVTGRQDDTGRATHRPSPPGSGRQGRGDAP